MMTATHRIKPVEEGSTDTLLSAKRANDLAGAIAAFCNIKGGRHMVRINQRGFKWLPLKEGSPRTVLNREIRDEMFAAVNAFARTNGFPHFKIQVANGNVTLGTDAGAGGTQLVELPKDGEHLLEAHVANRLIDAVNAVWRAVPTGKVALAKGDGGWLVDVLQTPVIGVGDGFNNTPLQILVQRLASTEYDFSEPLCFFVVGAFTAWRGNTALRIARFQNNGAGTTAFDTAFATGAQFTSTISSITWAKLGLNNDINIFVGDSFPTQYVGHPTTAHVWKLEWIAGTLDVNFTPIEPDPASLFTSNFITSFATGVNLLDGTKSLILNSFKRLRQFDGVTGTLGTSIDLINVGTPDYENIHITNPVPGGFVLSSRAFTPTWPDAGAVRRNKPRALRTLNLDGFLVPGFFAEGGDADANLARHGHDSTNGAHYIVAGNGLEFTGTSYKWNGANPTKHKGFYKIDLATGKAYGDPATPHDFNIDLEVNGASGFALPLAIDRQHRIWFGGNVTRINGTAVTPYRLYRVDRYGQNMKEFALFDARVHDCKWFNDGPSGEQFIVVGEFQNYDGVLVGGMVFIDEDGNLLQDLNWP